MGFGVAPVKLIFLYDVVDPVVVLAEQLAEGLSPVPQEPFAHLRAADDFTGKHRKPRYKVVASPFLELFCESRGPGEGTGLVAVHQQIAYAFLSQHPVRRVLVEVNIGVEVPHPSVGIQFVNLQAGRFRRCWMVDLACDRPAEAVDPPASGGEGAFQPAVGGHLAGKVDDI